VQLVQEYLVQIELSLHVGKTHAYSIVELFTLLMQFIPNAFGRNRVANELYSVAIPQH
jgi:hypothetical protein